MKTAAAIVILAALFNGLPGSKHKKPEPAPRAETQQQQEVVLNEPEIGREPSAPSSEGKQEEPAMRPPVVLAEEGAVDRIYAFAKGRIPKDAVTSDELLYISKRIVHYSAQYGVEPELMAALIGRESRFDPQAVSPHKAKGLCQLSPATARNLGIVDPFDIDQNLNAGTRYFSQMVRKWADKPNKIELALASFLTGPGTVERTGGRVPSSAEAYIRDIQAYRDQIRGG